MGKKPKTAKPTAVKCKVEVAFPEPANKEMAEAEAELALRSSVHGAAAAHEYMKATFGDVDMGALVACLSDGVEDVWAGNMKCAEAMLYGQANALQAIFTSLARRANSQEYLKHFETHLRLALKAQSQCRATLETLATIKAGPAIFAGQANIAHGPQQVNNGVAANNAQTPARAAENESARTELLEVSDGERLDTGTAGAPGRSDSTLATVGEIDGATQR